MTGHASHNGPIRAGRHRRALLSLTTGLAFVAALAIAVASFPRTEVGRTLDAHLSQLADPQSWVR